MTDLLERSDFERSVSFVGEVTAELPEAVREFQEIYYPAGEAQPHVEMVDGQGNLFARGYVPIREIGKKGILHMVPDYINDVQYYYWPELTQ